MSTPFRYSRTNTVTTANCWMLGTKVMVPVCGSICTLLPPPAVTTGCRKL